MVKSLSDVNNEFEEFYNKLDDDYDKELIRNSYEFAKKSHIYQKRQTGEPYVSHPLEVAKLIFELGLDSTSISAAFLHDVVEDTDITSARIGELFGGEVELIVEGLTKITDFDKRKEDAQIDALRKVLLASAKDVRILMIKLCDRLHNMRTMENLPEKKRERISKETMLIYVPIAQKIGLYNIKWELEDNSFKYTNREMYNFIKHKVNLKREEREEILNQAVEEIKEVLNSNGIDYIKIIGRPKNFHSIYKKIKNKAKTFEEIQDLYAIRIIAKDITKCYAVLGTLHDKFQAFPDRLKDYIANPKLNGYQSIHTNIYSKAIRNPIEIQVRTEEMHKLAEFGIAAHWRYKSLRDDKRFEKKIAWLREILLWEKENSDNKEFLKLLKFDFFEDEIFVFTPKNEVVVLPENATALDFAYSVHTEIGDKAYKAKINGSVEQIDTVLKSSDIIEIITNKNGKPSEKWLKFVVTNKAILKIRQSLNLKKSGKQNLVVDEVFFEKLKTKIHRLDEYKKSRKAGCCNIGYGKQIVGVVGKGKEIVIHSAGCENAKYTINEKIQLRWKEEKGDKEITINLILKDKIGLLMDILNLFSSRNINLISVNSKSFKNGDVKMTLTLLDGSYVDSLEKTLKEQDYVKSIKISKGLFGF